MGAFFIASKEIAAAKLQQLDAAHRARGFALARMVPLDHHTVFQYRKLDGEGGVGVETAGGGFACVTGQLIYRSSIGEEALRRYCADLARGTVDDDAVLGQFALLLRERGRLRLITDAMGFFQVYADTGAGVASSSFWAMLELLPKISIDETGVYQYAWNGATFGGRTFVREIRRLPADAELACGDRMTIRRRHAAPPTPSVPARSSSQVVETHAQRLRTLFAGLAEGFGALLRVSFSSGYDSRLMLAGLMAAGLRPRLFVYGRAGAIDVEIARQVATGEGLSLDVIDKSRLVDADTAASPARQERDFDRFDAWKVDGIFDDGADAVDRLSRHDGGGVPLNGSLGEIYRNFFYIPNRPTTLKAVTDSFFSAYAPAACTRRFSPAAYTSALVRCFQEELCCDDNRVSRDGVERLYPLVRGRYWTGRDVNLNLRFGRMVFPFMHRQLIAGTAEIPIPWKNHGRLEAKLIERLAPTLAGYPSGYGYRFCDPPPLRYRARNWLTLYRPPWLRRRSYRLRFAWRHRFPAYLAADHLAHFMDGEMPYMRRFFHLEHLHDADAFNRVATMEYIFQRYSAQD